MRMGLGEANQHCSKAIKAVKSGQEVVLTDQGKPIAVIKPLESSSKEEAVVRRMEEESLLRAASKRQPLSPWTSRPVKGKPLSQTIREERDHPDAHGMGLR